MILLYVAMGAALGGVARHGLAEWVHSSGGTAFPWATFTINATGSLLIGFAIGTFDELRVSTEARAFIAVGLLGGFTTFSSFSMETVALMRGGEWARAAAYSVGSVATGVAAALLGLGAASAVFRTTG